MSRRNRDKRTAVRGNFANYTAEKPLFGKYVGSVYRPNHERGGPENTTKDLEVIQLEGPKSIYLAGKIALNDWRFRIVKNLDGTFSGSCGGFEIYDIESSWPVMPGAVFGLDYTGPYFVNCDHGCFHSSNSHGFGINGYTLECDDEEVQIGAGAPQYPSPTGSRQLDVIHWCTDAINRSDVIFAWIDDITCYGTLTEIGYAKALNKCIWIAGTNSKWMHEDIWFASNMANEAFFAEWLTPAIAIQIFMAKQSHTMEAVKARLTELENKVTINGR